MLSHALFTHGQSALGEDGSRGEGGDGGCGGGIGGGSSYKNSRTHRATYYADGAAVVSSNTWAKWYSAIIRPVTAVLVDVGKTTLCTMV